MKTKSGKTIWAIYLFIWDEIHRFSPVFPEVQNIWSFAFLKPGATYVLRWPKIKIESVLAMLTKHHPPKGWYVADVFQIIFLIEVVVWFWSGTELTLLFAFQHNNIRVFFKIIIFCNAHYSVVLIMPICIIHHQVIFCLTNFVRRDTGNVRAWWAYV